MEIHDINTKALLLSLKALLAIREKSMRSWVFSVVNIETVSDSSVNLELVGPYIGASITLNCDATSWKGSALIPDIEKYKYLIDQAWADKERDNQDAAIIFCEETGSLELLYGRKEIFVRDDKDKGHEGYPNVRSFFDREYEPEEDTPINLVLMGTIARAFKPLFKTGTKMMPFKFQPRGVVINLDSGDEGLIAGIDHIQVITTRVHNHK